MAGLGLFTCVSPKIDGRIRAVHLCESERRLELSSCGGTKVLMFLAIDGMSRAVHLFEF